MPEPLYFELLEACQQPNCPICRLVDRATLHYLEMVFYEHVNDISLRAQLRDSLGLCRQHAWQAVQGSVADPLGVAIIYHDVFTNVLRRLPKNGPEAVNREGLLARLEPAARRLQDAVRKAVQALTPSQPCPACQQQAIADEMYLNGVRKYLDDERLQQVLRASDGLCLPHLRGALERAPDEAGFSLLLAAHRQRWAALDAELEEIIRKADYRFSGERSGSEADAWRRAIAAAVGNRPPQ